MGRSPPGRAEANGSSTMRGSPARPRPAWIGSGPLEGSGVARDEADERQLRLVDVPRRLPRGQVHDHEVAPARVAVAAPGLAEESRPEPERLGHAGDERDAAAALAEEEAGVDL